MNNFEKSSKNKIFIPCDRDNSEFTILSVCSLLGFIADIITIFTFSKSSIVSVPIYFFTLSIFLPLIYLMGLVYYWAYLSWWDYKKTKKNIFFLVNKNCWRLQPLWMFWILICLPGLFDFSTGYLSGKGYLVILIASMILGIIIEEILGIVIYGYLIIRCKFEEVSD